MTWQTATEPVQEQAEPDRLQPDARGSVPASDVTNAHAPRRPSRFLLRFFDIYLSLYVPLHFNGLRLAFAERFPVETRPLIVVINHPSWWDPLTSILISRFLLRRADHYAPIDALSLPRHRILGGLGLFPVEQGTPRGAVQFLRAAQRVLADRNAVLWLTPQGGFTDVRVRPVVFKSGLASLIKRLDEVTVLPLAYEYTYWDEPKPEMLACCGEPLRFRRGRSEGDAGEQVAAALTRAQDELAGLALMRDPRRFTTVMGGKSGMRAMGRNVLAALRADEYRGTVKGTQGRGTP
jgi:1-acyl-sn-glycerol-3-phosphate acyltransferase